MYALNYYERYFLRNLYYAVFFLYKEENGGIEDVVSW